MEENKEFWVECNVCKTQLQNWAGSTPCCGSIAYLVEDDKITDKIILYGIIEDDSLGLDKN